MKKTTLNFSFFLAILLVLLLAACSSTDNADPVTETGEASAQTTVENATDNADADAGAGASAAGATNGFIPGELGAETELILGTVLLDGTGYAVDAEQAAALLPLWKALRSLGASETTAQAEIEALIVQIEENMTAEQLDGITAMGLSMQDMAAVSETLGIESAAGNRFAEADPEMQATMQAARESGAAPGSGQFPGGMGPGGGQGMGGGGEFANLSPEEREALIAERGGMRGARLGINTGLLDGLIQFLEAKTQ